MGPRLDLARLVDLALERQGARSGAELARIAAARNLKININTINSIRRGTYRHRPSDSTIEALALLSAVPRAAAFRAAGLPPPGPSFAAELPDGVDRLTVPERDIIIRLCRLFLQRHDERLVEPPEFADGRVSELRRDALRRPNADGHTGDSRSELQ